MNDVDEQLMLAKKGDVNAQFNVGFGYQGGVGLPQSYSKAISWYRKAAEQGHAASQYGLSLLLAKGQGCARSEAKAAEWCGKAAKQGHQAAQFNLAAMYENGVGVKRDLSEAYVWFALASCNNVRSPLRGSSYRAVGFNGVFTISARNNTAADGNRNRIARLLSDGERESANKLASAYFKKYVLPYLDN